MEQWEDQGIILSVRPHGESGGVVSLLTRGHGRHAGYVRGVSSTTMRGTLQPGNTVDARWSSRVDGQLGSLSLELSRNPSAEFLADALRLGAMLSACALCDTALPEREGHEGLYLGLEALLNALPSEIWAAAYIMWEIALLRELGFSLDLGSCALDGDPRTLAYVSPKTGRAVSYAASEPYRDRLLSLPAFLKPNGGPDDPEEIMKGLKLTGHFLEHWVYTHHSQGVPEARLRFEARFAKYMDENI